MSGLYDPPSKTQVVEPPESGLNLDGVVDLPAGITLQIGSFDGKRWFALNQSGQSIVVTWEELEELVSALAGVWKENKPDPAPVQLQLFDPDSPPEAPDEHRLDSAH
jgi:hypothetical protein